VGVIYLTLALAFGASLPDLIRVLAPGALAGMLLYVAVQHALLAASLPEFADRAIAAAVGVVTILSGNLGIGFAAGMVMLMVRWVLLGGLRRRPLSAPAGARR
jgi:hypothetical protein